MRYAVLLGVVAAMLAGCGGGDETGSDFPRGVTDTTITIGTHTDLSGPIAIWGVPEVNGMRMRFDELAKAGGVYGRTIDLAVEDSQYQVPLSVKAVNKLINVDHVFAIIGAMGTPNNHASFDKMFAENVPSLFPLTAARTMYEPLHPLKFAYFVSYQNQVHGAVTYLNAQNGYERICLQAPATDYGAEVLEGYESIVEELGLESVYVGRHKVSETDFVGTAAGIKNSGCQLLFMGAFIKDTILLYTALRDAGWDGDVVTNMVPYLPEIPAAADGGMEGLYAAAPIYVPDFAQVEAGSFAERWHDAYTSAYGEEPAAQSIMGYTIADLFVKALENAGPDLTVQSLIAGIESIDHYEDLFGGPPLSFSPTKHVAGNYVNLYRVVGQKWTTVAENLPY